MATGKKTTKMKTNYLFPYRLHTMCYYFSSDNKFIDWKFNLFSKGSSLIILSTVHTSTVDCDGRNIATGLRTYNENHTQKSE